MTIDGCDFHTDMLSVKELVRMVLLTHFFLSAEIIMMKELLE